MESLNYSEIYRLQDTVLEDIFSHNNEFYLTGGTCLNRFYYHKRFSDDLDFFCHGSNIFRTDTRLIRNELRKKYELEVQVEGRDFVRYYINNTLQLDFVNDSTPRLGTIILTDEGYRLDTPENILSNKITAVLGRDNPKDIFDMYLICMYHSFEWREIIRNSKEKAFYNSEDLILRLETFPQDLLDTLALSDIDFLKDFQKYYAYMIEEIKNESKHVSFAKQV